MKEGQSQWFVGYKKHTLRLWLAQREQSVLLAPLVSWIAPANRADTLFLRPSLDYCAHHLQWVPELVVADKAYIDLKIQGDLRQRLGVGVLTKLRGGMLLVPPFEPGPTPVCQQGQPLHWLGLDARDQHHWFGVTDTEPLCLRCWEQNACPRQFSYPANAHEILFGRIPLASRVAQILLQQVRPWIEPAQSYEKNQLGLNQMFLNSLRLTWTVGLLADTIALLKAHALLRQPFSSPLLHHLLPSQLSLFQNE